MSKNFDFLDSCREFIDGSGLAPTSKPYRRFISLFILLPIALILDALVLYNFRFTQNDILQVAEMVEAVASLTQPAIRKFILIVHGRLVQTVLHERKQFWSYDLFGVEFGNHLRQKMTMAGRVIKTIIILGVVTITLMCVSIAVSDRKKIILASWSPKGQVFEYGISCMELMSLSESVYLFAGIDAFYVLMCTDIKIQFKLLQRKIASVRLGQRNDEDCFEDLKSCARHHNLLLNIHKKVNRIFSEYFLVQYLVTVMSSCIRLYVLNYTKANLEQIALSISYLVLLFFQVALFFLPASDVEIEAEKLAVVIYNVNWECINNSKIRKQLLFMLMKAQKPLYMLGGGMLHANRSEYIVLFRLAFSISTLMGGMRAEE